MLLVAAFHVAATGPPPCHAFSVPFSPGFRMNGSGSSRNGTTWTIVVPHSELACKQAQMRAYTGCVTEGAVKWPLASTEPKSARQVIGQLPGISGAAAAIAMVSPLETRNRLG